MAERVCIILRLNMQNSLLKIIFLISLYGSVINCLRAALLSSDARVDSFFSFFLILPYISFELNKQFLVIPQIETQYRDESSGRVYPNAKYL